ncbi:MAG: hypothetical protein IJS17_04465, partial [Clostridia bacterium]|nr:hypothetical protein [Clostridia bacterium]
NSFSEQCVNTYKNTLIFSHFRTIRQLKLYLYYVVIAVSIVCVTIIAICLILLNRFASRKRQMLRYIIYALGASWILIFIPSILIYNRLIPIYLSGMKLEFQFNLIMNYFYNAFHYLITVSYLLFAVYLILVAAWYYVATRKRSHI